jgi:hypothetical protein
VVCSALVGEQFGGVAVGLSQEYYAPWAVVTTGGSCGTHEGPCPTGVWGPYASLIEAHEAAKGVIGSHKHVVPYGTRGNRSSDTSAGTKCAGSGS